MEEATVDRLAIGRLAKALEFVCGRGPPNNDGLAPGRRVAHFRLSFASLPTLSFCFLRQEI